MLGFVLNSGNKGIYCPLSTFLRIIVLEERFKISGKLKGGGGASRFFAEAGQKPTDSLR